MLDFETSLDIDFTSCDTKSKKIKLEKLESPDIQDNWIEAKDKKTDEILYYKRHGEEIFYPNRNFYQGELRNRKNGKLIFDTKIPEINSKFGKIRCDIVANYEKPKKIESETLIHLEPNEKNVQNVQKMQLQKAPLRFYYEDQKLFDKYNNLLFIEWKGVTEHNSKDGRRLLKGEFFLGEEKNSQPMRLLRKMFKLANYPKDLWSTNTKKGSAIRAYQSLTTRIDGTLYRLKDFFPPDTRKTEMPKKPKKREIDEIL